MEDILKIKKAIMSTLATAGLTAGMLLTAAPAQADHYWVHSFDTKQQCLASTGSKFVQLYKSSKTIVRSTTCKHFKGEYKPYYSNIRYR